MNLELTDTFGGDANYSWVRRTTVEVPSDVSASTIIRKAKAWAGWTGVRCNTSWFGDYAEVRPRGVCQVMFITSEEN